MASQTDIDAVKVYLPDGVAEVGWTDEKIGAVFDTFSSVSQTVRAYWIDRVNNSTEFADISESGSSRSLTQVHENYRRQVEYWDDIIAKEKQFPDNRPRISFGQITLT